MVFAQTTGVSHPEQVPVTTSPEGIAQPVVYEAPARVVITPVAVQERPADKPVTQASARTPLLAPAAAEARDDQGETLRTPAENPDAGIVSRMPGPANQLPSGAMLKFRLFQSLSTADTAAGTPFTGSLVNPVERDGRVLLPAGAMVRGHVTEVHRGKRGQAAASMHLEPTSVTLPDGTEYALHGIVIDTGMYRHTRVDEEGTLLHKGNAKGTVAAVGLATGSGAAAGGVFGGWPGALIGGAVGLGVGTAVWLRQDRQADLPVGTEVTVSLTGPLSVGS